MKGCELCPNNNTAAARVYCESDEASLCFECDAKVHGANFLVARHSRVLLCRRCQSPTPWRAEGRRLGPSFSLCHRCLAASSRSKKSSSEEDDEDIDDDDEARESEEDDNEGEDDDEESEEEDEEGEEQVVPETMDVSTAAAPPPPLADSSSGCEEEEEVVVASAMMGRHWLKKRTRENVLLHLPSYSAYDQDQLLSSSPLRPSYIPNRTALRNSIGAMAYGETASDSFRPLKDRKTSDLIRSRSHQLSFDMMSFATERPPI